MRISAWHSISLRRALLLVLLPGMLAVVGAELWLTWRTAVDASNAAYDRSLLGAIKSIDANISTESGGLSVELPYAMLEFFELTASGQVYFRVAAEDLLVETGIIRRALDGVRVLNKGEITASVTINVTGASAAAIEAVAAAGGTLPVAPVLAPHGKSKRKAV